MLPFVPFAAGVVVGVAALKWFKQSQDSRAQAKAAPADDVAAAPTAVAAAETLDPGAADPEAAALQADTGLADSPAGDKQKPRKPRGTGAE